MPIYRNWKDPAEYEFTKTLSNRRWAWEFLRRNPEYQADWEYELPRCLKWETEYRSNPEYKKSPLWGKPIMSTMDPMFQANPMHPKYLFKWGLYCLVNPEQDDPFCLDFEKTSGRMYTGRGSHFFGENPEKMEIHIPGGSVAYVFDLSLPLKPQMKKAYKDLQNKQDYMAFKGQVDLKKPKLHKDGWSIYLRILDAKAAGVRNNDEIVSVIYPHELDIQDTGYTPRKKVKNNYEAAQALVNGGYKYIVTT